MLAPDVGFEPTISRLEGERRNPLGKSGIMSGIEHTIYCYGSEHLIHWANQVLYVHLCQPGIEPGHLAWKASILTTILQTHHYIVSNLHRILKYFTHTQCIMMIHIHRQ